LGYWRTFHPANENNQEQMTPGNTTDIGKEYWKKFHPAIENNHEQMKRQETPLT
jgi:hypothetical protein